MAVVAGIDEAGYGPLLGPLVVSAAAFRLPDDAAEADLWQRFGSAVTREAGGKTGRVRVADSKAIHKGRCGLRALEENLLPFMELLGPAPKTAWELAANCLRPGAKSSTEYPWYRDRDLALPRAASMAGISARGKTLREGLAAGGGSFCDARSETLDVAEFNAETERAGSKATPLARCAAALMLHVCRTAADEQVMLLVDRQGGRKSYGSLLRAALSGGRVEPVEETDARSEYEVQWTGRRVRVRFEVRADSLYLPVALASMLSKYARELRMEMFNDFWRERTPDLRPTAGYYEDGLRFLEDIEPARAKAGIPLDILKRRR